MWVCFVSVQYSMCVRREKKTQSERERVQIRMSVLRLCCIWLGSPGQLGYHVMEKIAIFSSGSLTYLSPLTDTPPPSTPTYLTTSLLPPSASLCLPFFLLLPPLNLSLTPQQWVSPILLFHSRTICTSVMISH